MVSSSGRGEGVGCLSMPRAELISQPQLPPYLPNGGVGGFLEELWDGHGSALRPGNLHLRGSAGTFWKRRIM